ncbi:MAG: carboxypeptidase-like regulatory domain-containing protein [Acidobacteriia bacterium]|nr:carboxypeptidase-like regulatory domain-containing protein [Terriglobia bacterium]
MKNLSQSRKWMLGILCAGGLALPLLFPLGARAANYGRIDGSVSDAQGNPLMGATVVIVGPLFSAFQPVGSAAERVITDAHGRFAIERLVPGWYSLKVTSATRLPVMRNGIRVEAGGSVEQNFVLSELLSPLLLRVPSGNVSNWGDDWKWVLRTSASTRPVLRYRESSKRGKSNASKPPLPSGQRLVAMMPGATRRKALAGDPGMGSVLAYLRPLTADTDLLVAGSMGTGGPQSSTLAAMLRKDALKGDPQELTLVVHQLDFSEGLLLPLGDGREGFTRAQGLVASYGQTRRISPSVTVSAGFEVDYLNAGQDVFSSSPSAKLEYQPTPSNLFAVRYGAVRVDADGSLLERIGVLTAFPRVTMRGSRPRLEQLNHTEASYQRRLSRDSRVEFAAYRDLLENAAVWGFGGAGVLGGLAGNFLPNPAGNGVTLNAGNFSSSGVRAAFTRSLGGNVQVAALYAMGDALAAEFREHPVPGPASDLRFLLRTRRTQIIGGRIAARLPVTRTRITTSYEWMPAGRVTEVDPYGQASMEIQPYLGIQIRQPLPNLAFLPAKIEALADFRNLFAQGYTPASQSGEDTLVLTPVCRSFRGGFSVQF